MDRLAVILTDMIRSALAWEQEHGLPLNDSPKIESQKPLTTIGVTDTLNTSVNIVKGEGNDRQDIVNNINRVKTFEDLKGLRAEGYIRDSTIDQRDGFGPDIQRKNILRFAENYGLVLGANWYTEFVSSFHHWDKRQKFHQFLDDAQLDNYDVLLVDHTSRFGRNQAECIHYKEQLSHLGKVVVFVSQGIISGSDRDFLAERINETLDEQYSRNLSRYVSSGMAEKAAIGLANGLPPLGYRSELRPNQPERKVPDPDTMPALLVLLKDYASGNFSLHEVADHLNSLGYRTRYGNLFTGCTIKDVLHNRFYEGKVVFHNGLPDEEIVDGCQEISPEVRELWLRCQQVKGERRISTRGQPRSPARHFPFAKVLRCGRCHQPYYGETVYNLAMLIFAYRMSARMWVVTVMSGPALNPSKP